MVGTKKRRLHLFKNNKIHFFSIHCTYLYSFILCTHNADFFYFLFSYFFRSQLLRSTYSYVSCQLFLCFLSIVYALSQVLITTIINQRFAKRKWKFCEAFRLFDFLNYFRRCENSFAYSLFCFSYCIFVTHSLESIKGFFSFFEFDILVAEQAEKKNDCPFRYQERFDSVLS